MDGLIRTLYAGETSGEYTVDYLLSNVFGFDAERVTVTDGLVAGGHVTETHNLLEVRPDGTVECGSMRAGARMHCSLRVERAGADTGAVARFCGRDAVASAVAPKSEV